MSASSCELWNHYPDCINGPRPEEYIWSWQLQVSWCTSAHSLRGSTTTHCCLFSSSSFYSKRLSHIINHKIQTCARVRTSEPLMNRHSFAVKIKRKVTMLSKILLKYLFRLGLSHLAVKIINHMLNSNILWIWQQSTFSIISFFINNKTINKCDYSQLTWNYILWGAECFPLRSVFFRRSVFSYSPAGNL